MRFLFLLCSIIVFAGCSGMNFGVSSLNPQTDVPTVQTSASYELYSWHNGQDWAFSLFQDATKVPTFAELTDDADTIIGVEPMAEKLLALPAGTKVYWNLKRIKGTSLPDNKIIEKLRTAAKKKRVQLEVIAWP